MNEMKPWKQCHLCLPPQTFTSPHQFGDHLRLLHSKKEGGSYVCLFGPNGICPLLPYEGVNDRDYEAHIAKCHIFAFSSAKSSVTGTSIGTSSSTTTSSLSASSMMSTDVHPHHHYQNNNNNNALRRTINTTTTKHQNHRRITSKNFPNPSQDSKFGIIIQETCYRQDKPNLIVEEEWNIFHSSQNLTSALNDPAKARSYYDNLFTKDWGFTFTEPASIGGYPTFKKPSQILFENYLKKVSKRNKQLIGFDGGGGGGGGGQRQQSKEQSNESNTKSQAETLVPSLFFDTDFDLSDCSTFINLLNLFDLNKTENDLELFFAQQSKMNDIQKSLSEYLDIVEQDLAQQICNRSKDFFQVMSSMDHVMERLKAAIQHVSTVRQSCTVLDDKLVQPISRNIEHTHVRNKYRDLLRKINWIATVHQTQPTIQLLLSKSDYAGALDLISTSQEVVAQELNGVISFRHLKLQLMEIEKVIEQMMSEEFVKYLTAEWNRPILHDDATDEHQPPHHNHHHHQDTIQEEHLLSIIYGMLKLQKFNFIDTFREEAFTAIKTNVKQTVIEALSSEDNIEVSRIDSSLFEQTKCLKFDRWLACLDTMFTRLITLLKRVDLVYNVINGGFVTVASQSLSSTTTTSASLLPSSSGEQQQQQSSSSSTTPTTTATINSTIVDDLNLKIILPSDYYELSNNLKEILCSVCDFAHTRCAHIIELRVNDGSLDRLDTQEFVQLIQLIDDFSHECEVICGKKSPNLKLIIQIQSNKFVSKFHEEHKRKLKQLLDLEQWKAVTNLSDDFQRLCTKLVNNDENENNENENDNENDTKSCTLVQIYNEFKNSKINLDKMSNGVVGGGKVGTTTTVTASTNSYIVVNNERYVLVNAVINLLYMILEYCQYAQEISFLAADLLMRLVDLLKLFNSRTSQLVLGAEALQISGLKTISARTLIISLRVLTFVMQLVPRIKRHFAPLLTTKQAAMLKHLDEVVELYENHQTKIPDMVVMLVKDVVTPYLNKWVAKAPVPSASFQTISQHLSRLHDNIQDIIPSDQLVTLFERIHCVVIDMFRQRLNTLKIVNDGGPQHGLVTQELTFYMQSLHNLSTIGKELKLNTNDLWIR